MKVTHIVAAFVGMIAASDATRVQMCKAVGKRDCIPVDSNWGICTNLVSADGRPYVSGYSEGSTCDIFSARGCSGTGNTVDQAGWSRFPFNVASIRC